MKNGLIVDYIGNKRWYLNDKLHREDGPAVEYTNGNNKWYQYDKLHRIDGPAIEWFDGKKFWYINGLLHRLDGPAIEHYDQDTWYINNNKVDCKNNEEFLRIIKMKAFW